MNEALEFIRTHKEEPFFCYLPITPPHGMYDIPQDDPAWELYGDDPWMQDPSVSQDVKNYAAMVSMVDHNVGQVLDLLAELGLEENTIVFFTGDNGGQDRFKSQDHPRGFFGPNVNPRDGVEFRGGKGNLYEGGLRIPFLVKWPGKIEAGRVSDLVFYQPDVLPTLAELTASQAPDDIDGISILPELLGPDAAGRSQPKHEYLYWEFGNQTAVRVGQWKALRPGPQRDWELYDLDNDLSEAHDVAAQHPERVEQLKRFAEQAHEPVRPGTYLDPERQKHEKDRRAKWGSRGGPARQGAKPANRLEHADLIPAGSLKLEQFSSENRANDRLAIYAIDGDPRTIWHSQFSGRRAEHPHELLIDLGQTFQVSGFQYLARQDQGWNGAFAETEFFVSNDPQDFGEPAAKVTFEKLRRAQTARCQEPVLGRYVRVRVVSEVNQGPWASAADIGVLGVKVDERD